MSGAALVSDDDHRPPEIDGLGLRQRAEESGGALVELELVCLARDETLDGDVDDRPFITLCDRDRARDAVADDRTQLNLDELLPGWELPWWSLGRSDR